jgi:cytochrome d ubiquinol oxidase subunit I
MQTPAGYRVVQTESGPRAQIVDFWAVVFSPSSMQRLTHVVLGAWVLGAFVVLSVSAWYLLKRRHEELARRSFVIGLLFGSFAMVAIWISGDSQARKVAHTQPAKCAAIEGNLRTTEGGTPLVLFGVPNVKEQRVDYGLAIPGLLSFLVYGDPSKPVEGLDRIPPEDRPPVAIPFQAYHVMVGIASGLLVLVLYALLQWWRGRVFEQRWLLWCFVFAVIAPYLANQSGWVTAEVGRQPWVVYGVLRTSDAFSPRAPAGQVAASLVMFSIIYFLLFTVWLYALTGTIRRGPDLPTVPPAPDTVAGVLEAATVRSRTSPYELPVARD